eukprot:CAMPEP_0185166516 /NCGR_PEP_ID=MMETSP1139-20130426/12751_1 /TAXON_ID=298111 /ORGANISM="Pavlova sp., Strain CCMP459" /LENGTH=95 /DNA_ID=CAMNT_0027731965 /DNA_START=293 /DNA_END=580 /DNA_ORIENTATION=+
MFPLWTGYRSGPGGAHRGTKFSDAVSIPHRRLMVVQNLGPRSCRQTGEIVSAHEWVPWATDLLGVMLDPNTEGYVGTALKMMQSWLASELREAAD